MVNSGDNKKRTVDLTQSPTKPTTTKKNDEELNKKKQKPLRLRNERYKFAPIDTLSSKNKTNTVHSISVTQLRRSKKTDKIVNELSEELQESGSHDTSIPRSKSMIVNSKQHGNMSNIRGHIQKQLSVPEPLTTQKMYPEEEVIWRYTPLHSDKSDKTNHDPDSSELNYITNGPSSTPIVPNRWKTIINLNNMNDSDTVLNRRSETAHRYNNEEQNSRDIYQVASEDQQMSGIPLDLPSSPDKGLECQNSNCRPMRTNYSSQDKSTSTDNAGDKRIHDIDQGFDSDEELLQATSNTSNFHIGDTEEDDDDLLDELLSQDSKRKPIPKLNSKLASSDLLEKEHNSEKCQDSDNSENSDDSLVDYLEQTQVLPSNKTPFPKNEAISYKSKDKSGYNSRIDSTILHMPSWVIHKKGFQRLLIISISEMNLDKIGRQKILICKESSSSTCSVIVRHPWVYLDFKEGDIIHIIEGKNCANKRLLSSDVDPVTQKVNDNLLILNPDILLSATMVGTSIDCPRKALLNEFFQDCREEPSLPILIGNIVHELLQEAFRKKVTDNSITLEYMQSKLNDLLDGFHFSIVLCGENKDSVKTKIMEDHFSNIFEFVKKYVSKSSYGCYVPVSGTRRTEPISISDVIDIEENIVSPMYGFKGFLDASVEALVERNRFIVPLEIKTGKSRSIAHEAQGLIYTLLLKDRYEMEVDFYLLYYTRDKTMNKFPQNISSIKHVLMARNQLTTYLKHYLSEISVKEIQNLELPPVLGNSFCDNCYLKDICDVVEQLTSNISFDSKKCSAGNESSLTRHFSESQKQFFIKYNDLITKEESSYKCLSHELFLMDSIDREKDSGKCLSNLVVKSYENSLTGRYPFVITFKRSYSSPIGPFFLSSQLTRDDHVLISDEGGHFGLSQGIVISVEDMEITVAVNRKLLNNNISEGDTGTKKVISALHTSLDTNALLSTQNQITYRIDKNDIQQGLSMARYNLLNLFNTPIQEPIIIKDPLTQKDRALKSSEGGDIKTRLLLVDGIPPKFRASSKSPVVPYNPGTLTKFNVDQKAAIDKVMRAEDYCLILGMPGTGKTTVIAEIIHILVKNNKSVLLTSYTHSAVDNIMLKLKNYNTKMCRLGSRSKIHSEIIPYIPDYSTIKTLDDYVEFIDNIPVVATTCLGIRDTMLSMRTKDFDYVIIDEASQIALPIALGPLRFADKFIMVGDHLQLPPLVKSESARVGGLEDSMFKILCERFPEALCELTFQYRMCDEIVKLSNHLIYDGKLRCGNEEVAVQQLGINTDNLAAYINPNLSADSCWLESVLSPKNKVLFLNYDASKSITESAEKDNITNAGEIELTRQCIEGMIESGVALKSIGVMTLYRAQLRALKKEFENQRYDGLEILTADQFQGRDKECIIISMVRSNAQFNGGSLLKELRRVNVAMTRAKSKLIIIGSRNTIGSVNEMKSFFQLLEREGWMYDLNSDCLDAYRFPKYASVTKESTRVATNVKKLGGSKPIDENSRVLRDKPIIRQVLGE